MNRKVNIEKATDIMCKHLRECDLDELAQIAGLISGAKLWDAETVEEIEEVWTFETTDDYCGMFDEILYD